jgi:hypothetical protein
VSPDDAEIERASRRHHSNIRQKPPAVVVRQ